MNQLLTGSKGDDVVNDIASSKLSDLWKKEDYLAIGNSDIFVAWAVTPVVLICTFRFRQNVLKIPSKTLNINDPEHFDRCDFLL